MIEILLIILLVIALFLITNSIIWIHNKRLNNINDIIIRYTIYINFIIIVGFLIFISYLYFYNLRIKIV